MSLVRGINHSGNGGSSRFCERNWWESDSVILSGRPSISTVVDAPDQTLPVHIQIAHLYTILFCDIRYYCCHLYLVSVSVKRCDHALGYGSLYVLYIYINKTSFIHSFHTFNYSCNMYVCDHSCKKEKKAVWSNLMTQLSWVIFSLCL